LAGTDLALARRRARSVVLAVRREVYEELRRRVSTAVTAQCADPVTADRLRRLARDRAGPGARIAVAADGGVVAVGDGLRVDSSAASLADHAVDLLGAEVERLWES
jgi:electron transfer flavoprotein alpha subunit